MQQRKPAIGMAMILAAAFGCRTTQPVGRLQDASSGSSPTAAGVPADFITAFQSYLAFYSPTTYAHAAAANPNVSTILFGTNGSPYDLQNDTGKSIDNLAKQTDFTAGDPNTNTIACTPTFIQADPSLPFRGSVVLLHGFSACPMQFYEYGVMLAHQGYHVLIPLLPGHGRAPAPRGTSPSGSAPTTTPPQPNLGRWYGEFAPQYNEDTRYLQFATYINDMVAHLPGDRFVVGLSGGAAVAHYMALERAPFYKRALLLSTYYHQRSATQPDPVFDDATPPTDPQFLAAMNAQRPFGTYCYGNTYAGRRGVCDLTVGNALALNRFATNLINFLQTQTGNAGNWPQTQFLSVANDTGSDTALTRQVFQMQAQANPSATSLCFFGAGVPHALVSKYDNRGTDMFWLPSFYTQSLDFIENGTVYPVNGTADDQPADGNTYGQCSVPQDQN